jgi:dGTPase
VFSRFHSIVVEKYPDVSQRRQLYETIRRMVDYLVTDLIEQSGRNIQEAGVESIESVRAQPRPLVTLSDAALQEHQELKRFLRAKLYNHPKVRGVMDDAGATLRMLFEAYMNEPSRLPAEHQALAARAEEDAGRAARARVVADYVAGMTDRFAFTERSRIGLTPLHPINQKESSN